MGMLSKVVFEVVVLITKNHHRYRRLRGGPRVFCLAPEIRWISKETTWRHRGEVRVCYATYRMLHQAPLMTSAPSLAAQCSIACKAAAARSRCWLQIDTHAFHTSRCCWLTQIRRRRHPPPSPTECPLCIRR
jgi:hypothetical protein